MESEDTSEIGDPATPTLVLGAGTKDCVKVRQTKTLKKACLLRPPLSLRAGDLAPDRKLHFKKSMLPEYMDNILITHLRLGNEYASVELHRYKDDTGIVIKNHPHDWQILLIK